MDSRHGRVMRAALEGFIVSEESTDQSTPDNGGRWPSFLNPADPAGRTVASHLLLAAGLVVTFNIILAGYSDERSAIVKSHASQLGLEAVASLSALEEAESGTRSNVLIAALLGALVLGVGVGQLGGASAGGPDVLREVFDEVDGGHLKQALRVVSGSTRSASGVHEEFLGHFQERLAKLQSSGNGLGAQSHALSSEIEAMARETRTIESNADSVANVTSEMSSNINTVAAAVEEFSSNVRNVAGAVEEMSTNLATISSNAASMTSSVDSVETAVTAMSDSMKEVTENSNHAVEIAERANQTATRSDEIITALGQSAQEIGKVINVIDDIAAQTNLLALNATIEAASAGDAGRGFAVVANEVKELAKQTSEATNEIGRKIEEIQTNTGDAVSAIQEIVGIITEINSTSRSIESAVSGQRTRADEMADALAGATEAVRVIERNVNEASLGAKNVAQNADELANGASEIARSAADASSGVSNLVRGINQVGEGVRTTAERAGAIEGASRELEDAVGDLNGHVGYYDA